MGLNTDDRSATGTTLSDEYALARRALGLSWSELARVTEHAASATFLPPDARRELVAAVRDGRAATVS